MNQTRSLVKCRAAIVCIGPAAHQRPAECLEFGGGGAYKQAKAEPKLNHSFLY